jgi:L-2-hydroxyglutarate oxidase LhgO
MTSRTVERRDFLVVGGGIVGVTIALELRRRHPGASILVLDKERALGQHASGRNSGVLHAGFYYTADSLKARFTRDGNRRLTAYCLDRGLAINRCGKLVVARDASELAGLDELLRRGATNGVPLESVSADEARRIEPRVRTHERAIWSPSTASVDPEAVLAALAADARAAGIVIRCGVAYRGRRGDAVVTSDGGLVSAGYVVNAAGLHADVVARDFGFSERYRILPFKGVYLYGDEQETLRTNVYPVPNLANPFLGVHFTVTVHGRAKIGPTAIPAFWREQYRGLERFDLGEFAEIVTREIGLLARNDFHFRDLAATEITKYRRRSLVRLAGALVANLDPARYRHWGRAGIRAQLLDVRARKLEMDFRLEGDDRSMHVLNAVSPAFTASLPFAEHVVDRIAEATGSARAGDALPVSAASSPLQPNPSSS